jgi:hypothetical protein
LDDAELGVVEHYTWHSQQEGGDVSIGQRERSYSSAAPSAAYTARNYASNIAEYNRKLLEINNSRRLVSSSVLCQTLLSMKFKQEYQAGCTCNT